MGRCLLIRAYLSGTSPMTHQIAHLPHGASLSKGILIQTIPKPQKRKAIPTVEREPQIGFPEEIQMKNYLSEKLPDFQTDINGMRLAQLQDLYSQAKEQDALAAINRATLEKQRKERYATHTKEKEDESVDQAFDIVMRVIKKTYPDCEDLISPLSTTELREVYKQIKKTDFLCPKEEHRESLQILLEKLFSERKPMKRTHLQIDNNGKQTLTCLEEGEKRNKINRGDSGVLRKCYCQNCKKNRSRNNDVTKEEPETNKKEKKMNDGAKEN